LLDSLGDGVLIVDREGVIRALNTRAAALVDGDEQALLGARLAASVRVFEPETQVAIPLARHLDRASDKDEAHVIETCVFSLSRDAAQYSIRLSRIAGNDRSEDSFSVVIADAADAIPASGLRDAILSMVSHELRTPLLHIKGFVSSLLESDIEWDEETRMDFLRTIDREADRLSAMVRDLMDISRMGTGELPLHLEHTDPYLLAYTAVDEASPFLRRHRMTVNVPNSMPKVRMDALRITGVLVNLIENATKYSDEGTEITIEAEERDDDVLFCVTDRGIGIAPDVRSRIFEMFYRVETAGKRPAGTGLGLAVSKAVIEAHKGRIWVESEPGKGSTFKFTLPRSGSKRESAPSSGGTVAGRSGGKRPEKVSAIS
jgi:signal transduction histidine kinase